MKIKVMVMAALIAALGFGGLGSGAGSYAEKGVFNDPPRLEVVRPGDPEQAEAWEQGFNAVAPELFANFKNSAGAGPPENFELGLGQRHRLAGPRPHPPKE